MSETLAAPSPADPATPDGHTVRRLATRARLLQAGTELFAEHGVAAVTTTAIARQAGVATGTFYLHFDDKHALFEELATEAIREMGAPLQLDRLDPADVDADEQRARLERMMRVAEERRDLIRAVFDQRGTSDFVDRVQDRIAGRLTPVYGERFTDLGVTLDPAGAAEARAAVIVRLVAWWADAPSPGRRRDVVDLLVEMDPLRLATGTGTGTPTKAAASRTTTTPPTPDPSARQETTR